MSDNETGDTFRQTDEESEQGQPNGGAAEDHADSVGETDTDARIEALQAEVNQHKDAHLRALAETENLRRRMARERDDAVRYASSGFARDLVPVADNLRRALQSVPEAEAASDAMKNLVEGVAATERELLSVFEKHNIKRIDPLDQKFDHNFHQAMFEVENTGKPAGTIVQVLQAGYVQYDRLLRAAMVGVAKGPVGAGSAADETAGKQARVDTTA